MSKKIILAPSLLAANFATAGADIAKAKEGGAEFLHLDVMDGIFVPNISFGIPVIKSLRACTDMVFDTHLMITEPERYIKQFADAGSDYITIHCEATKHIAETLQSIRDLGCKSGLAVKPGTPIESIYEYLPLCDMVLIMTVEPGFGGQKFMADMMPKAKALAAYRADKGYDFIIEADGGIGVSNAAVCVDNGIEVLVAGSSCFGKPDIAGAAKDIIKAAKGE